MPPKKNVEHEAVLVHSPPQPMPDAIDGCTHLVEMPPRTPTGFAVAQFLCEAGSEFYAPFAQRLMADLNAALVQQFLYVPVAQGKAVVQPNGVLDDGYGETVAIRLGVGHGRSAYPNPVKATQPLQFLFPRLQGVYGNMGWGDEHEIKWRMDKKICSSAYFYRYFAYTVPGGDVSDLEIDRLLELARTSTVETLVQQLKKQIQADSAEVLLSKLRMHEDSLKAEAGLTLALAVAQVAELFPHTEGMLSFGGPFVQAAILVGQLVGTVSEAVETEARAMDVVNAASHSEFALEIVRWLKVPRAQAAREESPPILPPEAVERVEKRVVERIRAEAVNSYLPEGLKSSLESILYAWAKCSSREETQAHLERGFDERPERLFELLERYLGQADTRISGFPIHREFERRAYDNLALVIDPESIANRLRAHYGAALETPRLTIPERDPHESRAHAFMAIHQAFLQEQHAAQGVETDDPTPGGLATGDECTEDEL